MARLASDARLGFFPALLEAVEAILKHLAMPDEKADRVGWAAVPSAHFRPTSAT